MVKDFFIRLLWALLLVFFQVLVFNHIHFVGHAIPLAYLYVILQFPRTADRWHVLLWGFVIGFVMDVFCNTPGMAASCMTALAMLQPVLLKVFASRVSDDEFWVPGSHAMGWGAFFRYAATATFIYVVLFFTVEAFSFSNGRELLLNIGGSFVLTTSFILALEYIRSGSKA